MVTPFKENQKCMNYTCCGLATLFLCLFFVICTHLMLTGHYNKYDCHITSVKFPTRLPTGNSSIDDPGNFCDCDCGKRCTSDLGICERIYVTRDISKKSVLAHENTVEDENFVKSCTFKEETCIKGELISDRIDAIEDSIKKMQKYVDLMQNNMTIDCYSNNKDEKLYLENSIDWNGFWLLLILSCVFVFICSCCFIITACDNYKTNKKNNEEIELKSVATL